MALSHGLSIQLSSHFFFLWADSLSASPVRDRFGPKDALYLDNKSNM